MILPACRTILPPLSIGFLRGAAAHIGNRLYTNLRSRLGGDKPRAYVIDALRFVGEGLMPSQITLVSKGSPIEGQSSGIGMEYSHNRLLFLRGERAEASACFSKRSNMGAV